MKVLIFGVGGFLGRAIYKDLAVDHEVYGVIRKGIPDEKTFIADLLDAEAVRSVIEHVKPDAIINSAGIVDPNGPIMDNVTYSKNILDAVVDSDLDVKSIVISGSAGEYGIVKAEEYPIKETLPLRAEAGYGLSKKLEEETALAYRDTKNLPVVVARVFNPIGPSMAEKFLVMKLKEQINDFIAGKRTDIEVSRKDSMRDYIAVDDIVTAFRALVEGKPKHGVYNVGSGQATSNGELVKLLLSSSKIVDEPKITETRDEAEPLVASQADITRMSSEFGWKPQRSIASIVEEIMNA